MFSQMNFECKLAHQDQTLRLGGFNSALELHQVLSKAFCVPIDQILFCTLNTHNPRDMDCLLGNYLSVGDLIVVQLCGNEREVKLLKSQEHLGLTITDNGHGRAFVKRVKASDQLIEQSIQPGDHIAAINGESTLGMRHYEVAKAIRQIPVESSFTIKIVEPLYGKENPNSSNSIKKDYNIASGQNYQLDLNLEGFMEMSLPIDRLLSRSANRKSFLPAKNNQDDTEENKPTEEQLPDPYRRALQEINTILESFLGINDDTLAVQIYRLVIENSHSWDSFQEAVKTSGLDVFSFGQDIERKLWNSVVKLET